MVMSSLLLLLVVDGLSSGVNLLLVEYLQLLLKVLEHIN
jgi:hypothetical protein